MRRRFFWRLFLGNAILLVVVVATCMWMAFDTFLAYQSQDLSLHLRAQAELLRQEIEETGMATDPARLQKAVRTAAAATNDSRRMTVIALSGTVLADSLAEPQTMENHVDRPEVRAALAGGWGEDIRYSHTASYPMKYVAVRLGPAGSPQGVVRVAMPLSIITKRTQVLQRLFGTTALIVLAAAVVLALGLARLWSEPVARITATARSLSQGDLTARAAVQGCDEIAMLAGSLNQMRDSLAEQIHTIDCQRQTLARLVGQLREGVIVVGPDGRIVLLNPEAERMLVGLAGDSPSSAIPLRPTEGRIVQECIGHPDLRRLLIAGGDGVPPELAELRLTSCRPVGSITVLVCASNITLPSNAIPRLLSASTRQEAVEDTATQGRLLVLTDITELERTIQVKTDFVANASHELRTPLTAIRAAVETLHDINPVTDPESVRRLLNIISRHNTRLEAMVRDLLDLSRVESPATMFRRDEIRLDELLSDLQERFAGPVAAKKLHWTMDLAPECHIVTANQHLLRLILDNLVDNAAKFTEEGGRIMLTCRRRQVELVIMVEDNGCGIPSEDHERVFERFYQVERARSGFSRGTGLGLSIVRHAVHALGGRIELQSPLAPGASGTRLTITIPQPIPSVT